MSKHISEDTLKILLINKGDCEESEKEISHEVLDVRNIVNRVEIYGRDWDSMDGDEC